MNTFIKNKAPYEENEIFKKLEKFIDFRFLNFCVQSVWNFVSEISEMLEKTKMNVKRLLLVWKFKKSSILTKYIKDFFHYYNKK